MNPLWKNKKIVFTHNTTKYLYAHYREFMENFIRSGAEVIVLAPFDEMVDHIRNMGIRCIDIKVSRQGMNPIQEVSTIYNIYRVLSLVRPDVVFNYSIKPVIYGGIAGCFAKDCKIFSMITGLGHLFMDQKFKYKIIRAIVVPLYRLAMRCNNGVFFQNPDDKTMFSEKNILPVEKGYSINGTGIDLDSFKPEQIGFGKTTFLLMSRLLWSKGIKEYVEASRILKKKYPDVVFQMLGPIDDNPASISAKHLEQWQREGVIDYLGSTDDVRPYLQRASVFVLPTMYREGRPRSILEAMAMGKPVITSNMVGCKDTVENGKNGFVVPIKNIEKLADAMEKFIDNDELISKMGKRSREIAEAKYSVQEVNQSIHTVMEKMVFRNEP